MFERGRSSNWFRSDSPFSVTSDSILPDPCGLQRVLFSWVKGLAVWTHQVSGDSPWALVSGGLVKLASGVFDEFLLSTSTEGSKFWIMFERVGSENWSGSMRLWNLFPSDSPFSVTSDSNLADSCAFQRVLFLWVKGLVVWTRQVSGDSPWALVPGDLVELASSVFDKFLLSMSIEGSKCFAIWR